MTTYVGDYLYSPFVDIELVSDVVKSLVKGRRSAGVDTLTCDHLQFCHPMVLSDY